MAIKSIFIRSGRASVLLLFLSRDAFGSDSNIWSLIYYRPSCYPQSIRSGFLHVLSEGTEKPHSAIVLHNFPNLPPHPAPMVCNLSCEGPLSTSTLFFPGGFIHWTNHSVWSAKLQSAPSFAITHVHRWWFCSRDANISLIALKLTGMGRCAPWATYLRSRSRGVCSPDNSGQTKRTRGCASKIRNRFGLLLFRVSTLRFPFVWHMHGLNWLRAKQRLSPNHAIAFFLLLLQGVNSSPPACRPQVT